MSDPVKPGKTYTSTSLFKLHFNVLIVSICAGELTFAPKINEYVMELSCFSSLIVSKVMSFPNDPVITWKISSAWRIDVHCV